MFCTTLEIWLDNLCPMHMCNLIPYRARSVKSCWRWHHRKYAVNLVIIIEFFYVILSIPAVLLKFIGIKAQWHTSCRGSMIFHSTNLVLCIYSILINRDLYVLYALWMNENAYRVISIIERSYPSIGYLSRAPDWLIPRLPINE